MLNVFQSLLDFVQMLSSFVENIVTGIFSFLTMIPSSFRGLVTIIGYIPAELSVFAIAGISICIVFHIIGR